MSEIGPIPDLNRFALDELKTEDGQSSVLLIVESKTNNGDVLRIEAAMMPEDAILHGRKLVEIGTALQATKH